MTAMQVAHEVCEDRNVGCVICGCGGIELHHLPGRKHKCGEILFATIFPLCKICHTKYHAGILLREQVRMTINKEYIAIMYDHIDRCVARNIKI